MRQYFSIIPHDVRLLLIVVQEMGAYAEEVFFSPDLSEQARSNAVRQASVLFSATAQYCDRQRGCRRLS